MSSKKILYISQEIFPYMGETEISKISRELPEFVQHHEGNQVRLFMPKFGVINERRNQLHEVIRLSGINLSINNRDHPLIIKVASIPPARMQVYFIYNDDFYKRKVAMEVAPKGVNDNDERMIFFVKGTLETVKKLRWVPDIIHCHGAFTALSFMYLKHVYQDDPVFAQAKLVVSLYNEAEPVVVPEEIFPKFVSDGIDAKSFAVMDDKVDYEALMKLAMSYADGIIQGSEELDARLLNFAKDTGKPFLPYPGVEHAAEVYNQFYEELL